MESESTGEVPGEELPYHDLTLPLLGHGVIQGIHEKVHVSQELSRKLWEH